MCVWLCMHMCVCVCLCVYVCEEVSFTFRIISTCLDISNIVWMILLLKNLCKAHTRTPKPCWRSDVDIWTISHPWPLTSPGTLILSPPETSVHRTLPAAWQSDWAWLCRCHTSGGWISPKQEAEARNLTTDNKGLWDWWGRWCCTVPYTDVSSTGRNHLPWWYWGAAALLLHVTSDIITHKVEGHL